MEIKYSTVAKYTQVGVGFYGLLKDPWTEERVIENADDLFQFMKDMYRENAENSGDYPMNGVCYTDAFSFHTLEWVLIDGVVSKLRRLQYLIDESDG